MLSFGKQQNEMNRETAKSLGQSLAELKEVAEIAREITRSHEKDDADKAEVSLRRDRAIVESFDHKQVIDDKTTPPSLDDCYAFLKVRVEGKIVDNTYTAYCASIIRQYFLLRQKVSNKQEFAIMNGVLNIHLVNLRPQYDYDLHSIYKYNNSIGFVRNKTIRILNGIYEIPFTRMTLENLNSLRADSILLLRLLLWTFLAISALTIIAYIAPYLLGLLFTSQTATHTMHSVATTPSVPTSTDTNPNAYPSTTPHYSGTTESSATYYASLLSGLTNSISSLWTDQKNDVCTLRLLGWCARKEESYQESLLSQSWRKLKQTSTALRDSSTPVIQHLMSNTGVTLSHSSAYLSQTFTSAKEHMTKSLLKYTNSPVDTNSTLLEIIAASTRTVSGNLYNYATDFIVPATRKTSTYLAYLGERFVTGAKPGMERATLWTAGVCRETLTQASETASSIFTSSARYFASLATLGMQSSMETISYYFPPPQSIPSRLWQGFADIIWNASLWLLKLILVLLSFVALSLFTIRMATLPWRLILTDYAPSTAALTIGILIGITSNTLKMCSTLIGLLIRIARYRGSGTGYQNPT
nr:TPA_asm: HSP90-containing protein [Tiger mosquito bi-segmented tombus-like virus]